MNTADLSDNSGMPSSEPAVLQSRVWPRAWLLLGPSALAFVLWFRWDWLAAAGLAPIVVAMLPCAVMCVLGVCMHRLKPQAKAGSCRAPAELTDESGERK